MTKQKALQKLFEKEMDRRQFLAHMGAAVLIISGFSGLLKSLINLRTASRGRSEAGYSSSTYGEKEK